MPRTLQDGEITLAFATVVLTRVVPRHQQLNQRLRSVILGRENDGPGVTRSNVGGWHSEADFLQWDDPDVVRLRDLFGLAIKSVNDYAVGPDLSSGQVELTAWANISRNGNYHQPHFHPSSDWSGVYYIATGNDGTESAQSGRIEMLDPRSGVGMLDTPGRPFTGTLQFAPEPGLMLVFPSWLTHHVRPHEGPDERISVAFNARMLTVSKKSRKRLW